MHAQGASLIKWGRVTLHFWIFHTPKKGGTRSKATCRALEDLWILGKSSHVLAAMYIYHEKQVSSLCGQHCINNLLQMPAFTAFDLADIAHELDARERQMMLAEGSTTPEALKFLAEDSGNVDEAGNFSLQVLSEALTRSQGLRLVSAGSEDVKGKLNTTGYDQEPGFVCNRHSHWLTIRNINGKPGAADCRLVKACCSFYVLQV
jgi:Josephin